MPTRLAATIALACLLSGCVAPACSGNGQCVSSQAEADRLNAGNSCPSYAYCPAKDAGGDAARAGDAESDAPSEALGDVPHE